MTINMRKRGSVTVGVLMLLGVGLLWPRGLISPDAYAQSCTNCSYPCAAPLEASASSCTGSGNDIALDCGFGGTCCAGLPIHSSSEGGEGSNGKCNGRTSYSYTTSTQSCTVSCASSWCVSSDCMAGDPDMPGWTETSVKIG